ncbi:MAG: Cys-tRNA(Pro) deacylase [Oscillospiraceae bacterium]|nr:Cys-tRNA(Pro) deacylase [Oscillospiraceae bacterium]
MEEKTNVMRILEKAGVAYEAHSYAADAALSAAQVAEKLKIDPARVFKTLVTVGRSGAHYVFMLPAEGELDLRKAARAAGEKSVEMVKSKELLPLTGYIHGGCSPVGMRKPFRTFVDETAILCDTIVFSAGKIGRQVEMPLAELGKALPFGLCDLCV